MSPAPAGVEDNLFATDAEQALDGVEIRAVLTYADAEVAPVVSETRTIHVDDHGSPARQQVTVTGESSYRAGDTVTLSADVTPATVLTEYRWERKPATADEFSVVEGETGPTLAFSAAMADHGAEYRAAPVTPTGQVAYGPSAAVALSVTEAEEEPGGEEPGEEPGGEEPPAGDEPGADEPGADEPGADEPGADEPGADEPGRDEPEPAGDASPAADPQDGGGGPADAGGQGGPGSGADAGGVLAATGASGLPVLIGGALLSILGGVLLLGVRARGIGRTVR